MGAAGVAPASIEIALGGVIVRVRGEADPHALTAVLMGNGVLAIGLKLLRPSSTLPTLLSHLDLMASSLRNLPR